jgi:hypothetical protein
VACSRLWVQPTAKSDSPSHHSRRIGLGRSNPMLSPERRSRCALGVKADFSERPVLAAKWPFIRKRNPETAYQFGIRLGEGALLGPRHLRLRARPSFDPCARKTGIAHGKTPGVLRTSRERHGSSTAGFVATKKSCASGFDICSRARISNSDSLHSPADRPMAMLMAPRRRRSAFVYFQLPSGSRR